jgi:predicted enzyme related to lactoylglutathione lyase
MPRPVHFEFISDDPERAAQFWSEVFGWSIEKWDGPAPYWLVTTGDEEQGIDGGLARREDMGADAGHTVVTVTVDSVDDTAAAVERAGGTVVMPRTPVPGVGWLIYCDDPTGTRFGAMESDPSAAADTNGAGA